MRHTPLYQLQAGKITSAEAYRQWQLSEGMLKKARFIKLRIALRDQKVLSGMLNTLFAVPIPLALAKPFIRRIKDPTIREFIHLIDYAKGIKVDVQSKDAAVRVSII